MKYIENAIKDVNILKALEEQELTIGSKFRVKELGKKITHSGSTFARLCRVGILKKVETCKEKIEIEYTKIVFLDPITKYKFKNMRGLPFEVRQRCLKLEIQAKKEIMSSYIVYELLVNYEDFAIKSFKNVMQECEHEIFLKMSRVQARIAEIYKGYGTIQYLAYSIEREKELRLWREEKQKRMAQRNQ